jgi:hypothetical protein
MSGEIRKVVAGLSAGVVVAAGACAARPRASTVWKGGETSAGWRDPGPFAPASLRVHPLTRIDRDESGSLRLVVYVELKDRWGDTAKGVGDLRVEVRRPGLSADAGDEAAAWDVSLWDADRNAAYFDPSTRTYRVLLGSLPAWVAELAPADGKRGARTARLLVQLRTPESDRGSRVLADEWEIGG